MNDTTTIQLRFQVQTPLGLYSNAIYYPIDIFNTLSEIDIAIDQAIQVNNWLDIITKSLSVIEETEEILNQRFLDIDAQLEQLRIEKEEIQNKIKALNPEVIS